LTLEHAFARAYIGGVARFTTREALVRPEIEALGDQIAATTALLRRRL
jgi:hypothetical protein